MLTRRKILKLGLSASLLPGLSRGQEALQAGRPIGLVVPFPPGAGTDSLARELAKYLSAKLDVSIVVDNKGGAGGAIATANVAKATPDGHTLLFMTSTFITHAAYDPSVSYDVLRDFSPIAMLGRGPLLVVSSLNSGIRSLSDLNERAKAHPGAITYCSAGPGSINHLAGLMYSQRAGINMTHVPYKGSGPATVDLLAGRTQIFFSTIPTIRAQITEARLNLLAVTSKDRSTLYPSTPTVMESGLPNYDVSTWWGVGAPKGLSQALVTKLNAAINAVSPDLATRLQAEGATSFRGGAKDFAAIMAQELNNWRLVVAAM